MQALSLQPGANGDVRWPNRERRMRRGRKLEDLKITDVVLSLAITVCVRVCVRASQPTGVFYM